MEIPEMLDILKQKAQQDSKLREEFLETRKAAYPLSAFCKKCRELGYPVYEMELIGAGEGFYEMKRSTNGGGENSPVLEGEDDFYELFFAGL